MSEHRRTFSGFTLIELLVVIAIVVILLSLSLPSMRGAMDSARTAGCAANQRQLGTVATSWSTDRGGVIIFSQIDGSQKSELSARQVYWDIELMDFYGLLPPGTNYNPANSILRGKRPLAFFACPASSYLVHAPSKGSASERSVTDFAKNRHISPGRNFTGPLTLTVARYGEFRSPNRVMLTADGWGSDLANAAWHDSGNLGVELRHRNNTYVNALFLDGHVEPRTFSSLQTNSMNNYPWREPQ